MKILKYYIGITLIILGLIFIPKVIGFIVLLAIIYVLSVVCIEMRKEWISL